VPEKVFIKKRGGGDKQKAIWQALTRTPLVPEHSAYGIINNAFEK
jgi:hypothetical protein